MNNLFEKWKIFDLENSIEYSKDGVISKQITKSPSWNITLFSFDKWQGLSEHTAPFDAMVQVIDWEADIVLDWKSNILKKWDCIIMPSWVAHAIQAITEFKMLLTMIKE